LNKIDQQVFPTASTNGTNRIINKVIIDLQTIETGEILF
jgi:hypothetical protein